MKRSHRLPALLLLCTMCASLLLGGCSQEPPASPDQVATGFYDLVVRLDASTLKDILGYESEDALWNDFVGGKEGYQEAMTGSLKSQFESLGLTLTSEDSQRLYDSIMSALGKLEFTAEVKEMDEKAKTAVVTAHIGYFDPADLSAMGDTALTAAMEGIDQATLQTDEGFNQFLTAYLVAFCDGLAEMEPADGQRDLTVDFEFIKMDGNGKVKEAWMPTDPEAFGLDLSNAAMGS